jgi:Na+(H+)/acetate symporter ActP
MNILLIGVGLLAVVLSFTLVRLSVEKLLKNLLLAVALLLGIYVFTEGIFGNGLEAAKLIAPSKSSGAFAITYSFLVACVVSLLLKLMAFRAKREPGNE